MSQMGFLCLGSPSTKYAIESNETLSQLQKELNAAKAELADKAKSETALSLECSKLRQENATLKGKLSETSQSVTSTSALRVPGEPTASPSADELLRENQKLAANNTRLATEKTDYETHAAEVLQNVLNEKRDLARQLKEKAEECSSLQQQCQQLKSLQSQCDQLKAQLQAVEGAHQSQLQDLRQSLDAAQTINDSTASSTSKLIGDYSSLQARYNQAQNELKLKDEMLGLLQQQLSEIAEAEEVNLKNASDAPLFRNLTMPALGALGRQEAGAPSLVIH